MLQKFPIRAKGKHKKKMLKNKLTRRSMYKKTKKTVMNLYIQMQLITCFNIKGKHLIKRRIYTNTYTM